MARHEEHLEIHAFDNLRRGFVDEIIRRDRLDLPHEPELFEEVRLAEHRGAFPVKGDLAAVLALDPRRVPHVVDVAMREEQRFHTLPARGEPARRVLRRVDEDARGGEEEAVRVEDAAGESVDFHVAMGGENRGRRGASRAPSALGGVSRRLRESLFAL